MVLPKEIAKYGVRIQIKHLSLVYIFIADSEKKYVKIVYVYRCVSVGCLCQMCIQLQF